MNDVPMIRIEMEGLKQSVMQHMMNYSDDYNAMVNDALSKTLNQEWVEASIQNAVDRVVRQAIDGLADNWELKTAINDVIAKSLSEMIRDD